MDTSSIAITGIGIVCPFGLGAAKAAAAYAAGVRLTPVPVSALVAAGMDDALAFPLPEFEAATLTGNSRMLKYMSGAAVLGCAAAREAVAARRGRFPPERIGLYAASGLAAVDLDEVRPVLKKSIGLDGRLSCQLLGGVGLAEANPLLSFKILSNIPPCLVSIQEQVKGPNYIFNPWEGQCGAAILEACQALAAGEVDCALTGGADTPSHPTTYLHLRQAGRLGVGEYPGAGAAYLLLERLETARRDQARIYAMITDISLTAATAPASDPLAPRMGRTFAAAPAIMLALAALTGEKAIAISGVDRQLFRARLGGAP